MQKSRICTVVPVAALLLAASSVLAGPPVAVSECGTIITEPGKYKVTQDLYCGPNQQGIHVLASDVTVDLKGHAITCNESGEDLVGAVLVGDPYDPTLVLNNVWVKKGTVSGCDDGVVFFYTKSAKVTKMSLVDNLDGGITLVGAEGTIVKNNVAIGNFNGIRSFWGFKNQFKGNSLHDNHDAGLFVNPETESTFMCNTSERDAFGIMLAGFSSGNLLRGNLINNAVVAGIALNGVGIPGEIFSPVPFANLIRDNIAQGSGNVDLAEVVYNPYTDASFVPDDAQCQNTWMNNQFVTQIGPIDCIGAPAILDDKDVCALDDKKKKHHNDD